MPRIVHGITGNKYVLGSKEELENVCDVIGKAKSSIRYTEKYKCHVIRIKSKKHKDALTEMAIRNVLDDERK